MKYKLKADIAQRKIENELFVFDRERGAVFGFSETGAIIWECLQNGLGSDTIVKKIVEEYEVTLEEANLDFQNFLNNLKARELVFIDND
jgi:hypothetical protein